MRKRWRHCTLILVKIVGSETTRNSSLPSVARWKLSFLRNTRHFDIPLDIFSSAVIPWRSSTYRQFFYRHARFALYPYESARAALQLKEFSRRETRREKAEYSNVIVRLYLSGQLSRSRKVYIHTHEYAKL